MIFFFLQGLSMRAEKWKVLEVFNVLGRLEKVSETDFEELLKVLAKYILQIVTKKHQIDCLYNFSIMIAKSKFSEKFSSYILNSLQKALTICNLLENQDQRIESFVDVYSVYSFLYLYPSSQVFFYFFTFFFITFFFMIDFYF